MLSNNDHAAAAETLLHAQRTRRQATQVSTTYPGIDFSDAYAISRKVMESRVQSGAELIGMKVGLTSKAMQAASKIDEPDFGYLLDDMLVENGGRISLADYCRPRVELELAFVMGERLNPPRVNVVDVLRATEYVVPSLEIIDTRVEEPRKIYDTISDNGAAAGLVLGGRPIAPTEIDLRWVAGVLYRNAEVEETGVAMGVLGDPAMGVAWLANKLHSFGEELKPGQIVLSGSFVRPIWAQSGDTIQADFGPLGTVGLNVE